MSLYSTYNITWKLSFLAIANLKYQSYKNFYYFLLLLSGDLSLNPGPVQISPVVSVNTWEPFNEKGLNFLHIKVACRLEISYILEIEKYTFVSIEIDEKENMWQALAFYFFIKYHFKPNKI